MKKRFYVQRVLATLFPNNFPKMYTSWGKHPDPRIRNIAGSVRQKIEGDSPYLAPENSFDKFFAFLYVALFIRPKVRFPFKKAERAAEEMGIWIEDIHDGNFVLGKDGGEYYVDSPASPPFLYPNTESWDHDKIIKYMKDNKYSENDIKKVASALNRIHSLDLNG